MMNKTPTPDGLLSIDQRLEVLTLAMEARRIGLSDFGGLDLEETYECLIGLLTREPDVAPPRFSDRLALACYIESHYPPEKFKEIYTRMEASLKRSPKTPPAASAPTPAHPEPLGTAPTLAPDWSTPPPSALRNTAPEFPESSTSDAEPSLHASCGESPLDSDFLGTFPTYQTADGAQGDLPETESR